MTETKLRDRIVTLARSIYDRGLTFGSSGNISVRVEDGWLMTPTGSSMGELDPARLSKLGPDGTHLSGDKPTKETFLHAAMYEQRQDCEAVVHLHSTHSVAVSCLDGIDPANVMPPITAFANHGPVVAGKSLEDAVYATEELEETAKLFLLLHQHKTRYLTPEQVADLHRRFPS
jgi:ribulose-5-phosphate 4-epimerase/fuculose-1-phosphate aldolase